MELPEAVVAPPRSAVAALFPASLYKTLVQPYGWTEPPRNVPGRRSVGILYNNNLVVHDDGAFEVTTHASSTVLSGTLQKPGEQICASSDLKYALTTFRDDGASREETC